MERRPFLSAVGVGSLVLAAGGPSIVRSDGSADPTGVVEACYRRASAAEDSEAFADDVRELAHGASPLSRLADDVPMAFDSTVRQEFVDADVVAEDVSTGRIRGISDFLAASLTDAETESIAAENALVSVTVEEGGTGGSEYDLRWLVATDDGEWRLVWPGGPDESDGL